MSEPYVGARVRWQSSFGTKFGEVIAVNAEAGTLVVQVEHSTFMRRLVTDEVALVSGGAK